jgi:hypothetical protein
MVLKLAAQRGATGTGITSSISNAFGFDRRISAPLSIG